jgi:hypothetical protein
MVKPGYPLKALGESVEAALEAAKTFRPQKGKAKNAICLADRDRDDPMSWGDFAELQGRSREIGSLVERYQLSTGYLYVVLECARLAEEQARGSVTAARWRSMLTYRTRRMVADAQRRQHPAYGRDAQEELMRAFDVNGISKFFGRYRLALSDHVYSVRDT